MAYRCSRINYKRGFSGNNSLTSGNAPELSANSAR